MTTPNKQHQFDLLYVLNNVSETNIYKYILISFDVASRYKVTRALSTKNVSEVTFLFKAIFKKLGVFKYYKVFLYDNGSEFKSDVTKLLQKHNVDIPRTTTKYKHTHTVFVEELPKKLFKPMYAQELKEHEKVSVVWVKNLNSILNKMSNTNSLIIVMKPKDPTKLDIDELDKTMRK